MSVVETGLVRYCPHKGCTWSFAGSSSRFDGYLDVHLRVLHHGVDPRAQTAPPTPLAPPEPPQLPVLAPALDDVEPDEKEIVMPTDVQESRVAEFCTAFRRFHDKTGRWPLPGDVKTVDYLPTADFVRKQGASWQSLWDEVGAGKVPQGRAAANYRTGRTATAAAKKPARAPLALAPPAPAPAPAASPADPPPALGLTWDGLAGNVDALKTEEQRLDDLSAAAAAKRDALRTIIEAIEQAA